MTNEAALSDESKHFVRHTLAAMAYRSARALKDVPEGYASRALGDGAMTANELVTHMTAVLGYVLSKLTKTERERIESKGWGEDVAGFYAMIGRVDAELEGEVRLEEGELERILQGPLLDVFTHIGQLASIRRVAGSPVPGENYRLAEVRIGRVGIEQAEPVKTR